MASGWDDDVNIESLSLAERTAREYERIRLAEARRAALAGYMDIPFLSETELSEHFASFRHQESVGQPLYRDENGMAWRWAANRVMWICHDCGCFGYKYTLRELFKCYNWHCRSRNVTVCRSGELSIAIRNSNIGVNMTDVFNQRRERMRNQNGSTNG